jgi:hypothetical protein
MEKAEVVVVHLELAGFNSDYKLAEHVCYFIMKC